jgi:arylsulfatase A-like enzyme/CRISPR/Cas system CSM-associated protein Csm2 small subunit
MPKSVILITIDSLRRDSVGFLNSNCRLTPFLDKLASKSTVMANAFAAGGGTIYAMGSLMTSSFPIINLTDRNIRGWPTLAQLFRSRGYRTAAFHSNPWLSQPFGFDQGFEEFRYIVPALPTEDVVDVGPLARRIPEALNEFTNITFKDAPLWIRASDLFEQATRWIDKLGRKDPYFLWVHPMDVHFPYTYPTTTMNRLNPGRILRYGFDFLVRYSDNRIINNVGKNFSLIEEYKASIQYLDGVLQNFCEKFPNSLIVIMSDHGDLFGEHGCFQHPGELYNEIIRIPVLIYDREYGHRVIQSSFSAIELGDIIRALATESESDFEPKIHQMFSIHVDYNTKVRRTSVVDGKWKLSVTENIGKRSEIRKLYDIEKDTRELQDQSGANEDIVGDIMRIRTDIMKTAERQKLKLSMRKLAPILQRKSIIQ